jgi:hypothetical protein
MGRVGAAGKSAMDYAFMRKLIDPHSPLASETQMTPEEKQKFLAMDANEKYFNHPEWKVIKACCRQANWEEAQLRVQRLEMKYGRRY